MRRMLVGVLAGATVMVIAQPSWGARDVCKMLRDKGVLNELEYNECKAADEKKDAEGETKTREVLGLKMPKWLDMLTPFGDMRTRFEGFYAHELHARNRFRLRARVGLTANVTDEIGATVRLASGNVDDPISTNQDFTRAFTRKPVNLDWAYLTLKPGKTFGLQPGWGQVVAGKFGVNAYRESELIWDDDLSPEGATETLNLYEQKEGFLRGVRINAFEWVIDELAADKDPWMGGGQVVADTSIGTTANWTAAFADYNFVNLNQVAVKYLNQFNDPPMNTKANSNFNGSLANSNSVVKDANGKITGYKSGFNVINFATEVNFPNPVGLGIPAGVFGDLAYNTQADGRNTGFYIGAGIGKGRKDWYHDSLKDPGDWGMSYTYAWVEKDALVSLFSYSDFDYVQSGSTQKGATNVMAHIIRFDYELFTNFQLTAKSHFINALDRKASNAALASGNPTMTRLQLDAVLKF